MDAVENMDFTLDESSSRSDISDVDFDLSHHQLSNLLKPEDCVTDSSKAEGLFLDESADRFVILGITDKHLVISSAYDSDGPGALIPLAFVSLKIQKPEERVLRIIFCSQKDKSYRLCEMGSDDVETWDDFVNIIDQKELYNGYVGDFRCSCQQDGSSVDSISILGNYAGFVSDQAASGDHSPTKPSWWQDGFTSPKHRTIEKQLREIVSIQEIEKHRKEIGIEELFECVHQYHFEGENGSIIKSCSNHSIFSNASEWSTSSVEKDSVKSHKIKKSRFSSLKKMMPKAIRNRFKSKKDKEPKENKIKVFKSKSGRDRINLFNWCFSSDEFDD